MCAGTNMGTVRVVGVQLKRLRDGPSIVIKKNGKLLRNQKKEKPKTKQTITDTQFKKCYYEVYIAFRKK